MITMLDGDRYRLDRHIATGGMGQVYEGTDTLLHRRVAVKLLRPEVADDHTFGARFLNEARHAAGLQHPGIAAVYDFGISTTETGRRPYLVMEYVDGRPLSELLAMQGPSEQAQAIEVVAQAADALQAAHDKGLVHRDVKPANLLVAPDRRVKVTDFGIAKAASDSAMTATGDVLGTPYYLSPEQAEGRGVTPASDVYALGVVLYECLVGVRPFNADTPVATALAHVRQSPPPMPDSVPAWLRDVTMRALAKDPSARQSSAAELAAQLREGGAAAPLVPPPPMTAVLPAAGVEGAAATTVPARRSRALVAAAVVAAGLIVVLGVVLASGLGGGVDSSDPGGGASDRDRSVGTTTQATKPTTEPTTEATTEATTEPTTKPPKEDKPPKEEKPPKGDPPKGTPDDKEHGHDDD